MELDLIEQKQDQAKVENDFCVICLEKFADKNFITIKCDHKFHKNCLREWVITQKNIVLGHPDDDLAVKGSCPLCRQKFSHVFLSDSYYDSFKVDKRLYPFFFLKFIYNSFR